MTGIVDVGGGLRGIFGGGIFDTLIEDGVYFDYCIGVSAGAANVCSFLGKQKGRNYKFYTDYSMRPEYMSIHNLIHTGSYLDLDYVYTVLSDSDGENPVDYETFSKYKGQFKVVGTNIDTAEPVYFDKTDFSQDHYDVLKATCCLPVVCKPIHINGFDCVDGGVSDPVPVKKAFDDGCDKLVLILTKPVSMVLEKGGLDSKAAFVMKKKYPKLAEALEVRYEKYNEGVSLAQQYEKEGKVLILAPEDISGLKTLTKDIEKLDALYKEGLEKGKKVKEFLEL